MRDWIGEPSAKQVASLEAIANKLRRAKYRSLPSLRSIADALDGDVDGQRVRFAPPGHSKADRSAWVEPAPDLPGGFDVGTFAGDDPIELRDYINQRLGNPPWKPTKANGSTNGSAASASHVVATYDYGRERAARLPGRAQRAESIQPTPTRSRKPGEWVWNLKGVTRLPYRLPGLLAAVHDACSSSRARRCRCAHRPRLLATCNSGGAGNWTPDLNEWFAGKTAYIIPDTDEQGRKHAQQVAENLYGIAHEIRIVDLPGLPDKKGADFQTGWRHWRRHVEADRHRPKAAPVWAPSASERKREKTSRIGSAADLRGRDCAPLDTSSPKSWQKDAPLSLAALSWGKPG